MCVKKRILATALSVLCLANLSACDYVPQNELVETAETHGETVLNGEQTTQANDEMGKQDDDIPSTSVVCANVPRIVDYHGGCHLAKDLHDVLRPYHVYSDQIQVKQDMSRSNVFYVTANNGFSEYSTTVILSQPYQMINYTFGFHDTQNGYLMLFSVDVNAKGGAQEGESPFAPTQLLALLKTQDGGKTWTVTEYKDPPTLNAREYISYAGIIDDYTGFFTAGYYDIDGCSPDFTERTFWTFDGGKSWLRMSDFCQSFPSNSMNESEMGGEARGTEIVDLKKVGAVYVLTVEACHDDSYGDDGKCDSLVQYCSADLYNWELLGNNSPFYVGGSEKLHSFLGIDIKRGTYLFYNFINEYDGYAFVFGEDSCTHLKLFLKTSDGGISWKVQDFECGLDTSWKEEVICAKMVDESVGLIAAGYHSDDDFSDRTYITVDGGKTWAQVVLPPDDYYTDGDSGETETYIARGEAYDLLYKNGKYVLCIRQRTICFQYASTDLKTWSFVEQ